MDNQAFLFAPYDGVIQSFYGDLAVCFLGEALPPVRAVGEETMPRILVEPEYLRTLSARWQQLASDLRVVLGRLSGAMGGLDWQVRQSAGVEGEWQSARRRAEALASQAEDMARYLTGKARAFEEADYAGSLALGQVAGAFAVARQQWQSWWQHAQPALSFPQALVRRLLRLGGELVQMPALWTAGPLGIVARLAGLLIGHRPLRPVPPGWDKTLQQTAGRSAPSPDSPLRATSSATRRLQAASPADYASCVLYARARRPDLGAPGGDGGAYNYIARYRETGQYYRLPIESASGDLRTTPLRVGSAVVWDRGVHGADPQWGHVAIVEEVGPDYVEVSEAGWATGTRRRIPADQLPDLHLIL